MLGTAATEHRFAPLALAAGLALSFTAIGLFVATAGFAVGLDASAFRTVGAALLIALGFLIAVPSIGERVAVAAGPVSNWANHHLGGFSTSGIGGQFCVGLLLGAVWSPCAGPTLGAATVLAAQGQQPVEVAGVMALFGVGAALPLLVLGSLSREAMLKVRAKVMNAAGGVKLALAAILVIVGVAVLSGYDKQIESVLVEASPEWLTRLITSF